MLKKTVVFIGVLAFAASAWAAAPLGSVTSDAPFELNGATVPLAGVPSWPVTAGDIIATRSAPATIVFRDGSRIVVTENSKVRIEARKDKIQFHLIQGSSKYRLAARSRVSLFLVEKPAIVKSGREGLVSLTPQLDGKNEGGKNEGGKDKDGKDKDGKDKGGKPPHPSPSR